MLQESRHTILNISVAIEVCAKFPITGPFLFTFHFSLFTFFFLFFLLSHVKVLSLIEVVFFRARATRSFNVHWNRVLLQGMNTGAW